MKTHWKKLVNPDFIGAYSLDDGKDLTVTIESVKRQMVTSVGGKQEECTVAYLKGLKPLIVNRTNAKTITKVVGSPYIEDWANKQITLFAATTKLKGEDVECLRIRENVKLPELNEQHKAFKDIQAAVKSKQYTMEQVRKKYDVSKQIEQLILS